MTAVVLGGLYVLRSYREDGESMANGLPVRHMGIVGGVLVMLFGVALVLTGLT
jgi:hypothetical protein